jgi:Zn-dependent protease with chaperone function
MQTYTIGRNATNDIVLSDPMVSRQHAKLIIHDNGQVSIKDLDSSNGTFVNGNRVTEAFLKTGDIVKCGSMFLEWAQYARDGKGMSHPDVRGDAYHKSEKNEAYSFSNRPVDIESIRHEKEKIYFMIRLIFSCLVWGILLIALFYTVVKFPFVLINALPFIGGCLFVLLLFFLIGLFYRANIFGHSVRINAEQFPEIYRICMDQSLRLGLKKIPDIFIMNGNGWVNAFARSFVPWKYVVLLSNLTDLMLTSGRLEELSTIIGHELGHHAAGHLNYWKKLLLFPSLIIPFLGLAYMRACELTADRIGFVLTGNLHASQKALVALALGSERLSNESNIAEFCNQENEIPGIIGWLNKIFSTHPRTTRRTIEISIFASKSKVF